MNSLKPINRRLLPDNATVYPPAINGSYGEPRYLRHVRFVGSVTQSDDAHRSDEVTGKVYIDAMNTVGAYQVQVGSRIVIRGISMQVVSVTRREGPNMCVHHWEVGVK